MILEAITIFMALLAWMWRDLATWLAIIWGGLLYLRAKAVQVKADH
eukprot:CAMPEP_0117691798 /NCGR_PEP_ID=MMETSP0804-20121206/25946_1 /TAXON_ID=1074897 /ORGANISM="Tetraselmis astigmatica, Strain CCMP880" /LENGTH=45 /DNA_ID= /DNA_START= /DNA_END= /DNA_ORIENTATION=